MKGTRKVQTRYATKPVASGPALEVIGRLAELMWEKEGCPDGRDIEFWLRAEAELKGIAPPSQDEAQP